MILNFRYIFFIGVNLVVFSLATDSNYSISGVADCIAQVVRLLGERKVAFEYAEDSQFFASEIIKKIKTPVVLNAVEMRRPTGIDNRIFNDLIIIIETLEPEKILKSSLWNGETRFLIISQDKEKFEKYFKHFWKTKVINVFALATAEEEISIYSFLPYSKQNCTMVELVTVDTCIEGTLKNEGFALKDPSRIKNINECPVKITVSDVKPNVIFQPDGERNKTLKVKGFEGKLMAEVAKIYNFKAIYKLPEDGTDWGWIHPSPHGAIADVYLGKSDLTIGMLGPLVDRYENLDFSINYNMDECLTFAVPQGYKAKMPIWITIFVLEFNFFTWALITFSFVLISINVWLINKYLNLNWFESKIEVALFLFSSFLGIPVKTPDFASTKTSVTIWIIFSFIITIAYRASMGSKLTVPPREADIYTFKELLETDLRLTGVKNMYQLMKQSDPILKQIGKRYQFENYSVEHVVDRIANHEKIANLRHKSTFGYYSMINPKARGRIHLLKDCLILYHPMVMAKKFSPFTNKISQVISRLEESGIMAMWRAEYEQKMPRKQSKPFFKLSIDQMLGIFCFLCIGHATASIFFLGETYFYFKDLKSRSFFPGEVKTE